jgi:hypothetical protein
VSATNRGATRAAGDFYETPRWAVEAILPHLPACSRVLEPSAGTGAIAKVLAAQMPFSTITAIELDPDRAAALRGQPPIVAVRGDFLELSGFNDGDASAPLFASHELVIGNPPYNDAESHVRAAMLAAGPNGSIAMLLRLNWLEGRGRAAFHREHPADVYVLERRPSFTGRGTDATAYAWFVWGPGRGGRWFPLACGPAEPTTNPSRAAKRAAHPETHAHTNEVTR